MFCSELEDKNDKLFYLKQLVRRVCRVNTG